MPRRPRLRTVAVALSLLLVAATAGVGVGGAAGHPESHGAALVEPAGGTLASVGSADPGPATVGPGGDASRSEVGRLTRCFSGDGYPISIGGEGGATMATVIHLSVLTDPGAGNEFGIETAGELDGEPIVTLAAGVRLTGREAIANGFDPFAAFDVLYAYDLRLPMFEGSIGDAGYEDDGSPIDSSAGAVAC
ncbi:hypothetical protein ABNG02_08985 [Halorubrum ejinorense]